MQSNDAAAAVLTGRHRGYRKLSYSNFTMPSPERKFATISDHYTSLTGAKALSLYRRQAVLVMPLG